MDNIDTLTSEQVAQLARRVAEGIVTLDDPFVKAPAVDDYVLGDFAYHGSYAWLRVRVGFTDFDVKLYAVTDLRLQVPAAALVAVLADSILARIAEIASTRVSRSAKIGKARAILDKALARHDVGVDLEGFEPTGESIMETMKGHDLRLEATFRLLSHTLCTRLECHEGWTGRDFAQWVAASVPHQRRRRAQLARLKKFGAALEVDALAEQAILEAGRTVGDVASELLHRATSLNDDGSPSIIISGEWPKDALYIYVRDGCMVASVTLPGVGVLNSRGLTLDSRLPATITSVLAGRSPSTVLDHPLLRKGVKIQRIDISQPNQTIIRLKATRRALTASEIEGRSMAA